MINVLRGSYVQMSRKQLKDVGVVAKKSVGKVWKGVKHFDFIEAAVEALQNLFSLKPHNETYAVSPDGATLVGGFELHQSKTVKGKTTLVPLAMMANPKDPANQVTASLGMRHSNNQQHALTWAAGGRVLVCENGIVTGEFQDKRRHTKNLNVKEWLSESLSKLMEWIEKGKERIARIKDTFFRREWHERAVLALMRAGVLPARLFDDFDDLWVRNTHGDTANLPQELLPFANGEKSTAWDWYNMLTWIFKQLRVTRQQQSLLSGMNLIDALIDKPKIDPDDLTAVIKPNWEFA